MSNTNEFKKILSAVGALGFGGAGIASLFTAGIAPLAWGSAAFVLAGISGCNLLATDKIDLLEEQNQEITAQLADLRSKCDRVTAERDDYKSRLEREVAAFKIRCQELQDGIEYWSTGMHPAILELPTVKTLVTTLKTKLADTSQKLEVALAEIDTLKVENRILNQKINELETLNDELDGDLASKLLELAQLKTNFDYKLRDELHNRLQPYCNQAVSVAVEKKLAEIDKLKQAIAMLQEDIGNYQSVMDSLEKDTLPEIEKTYKTEMSEADSKLMQLAGQNELLQQEIAQLKAPQQFPGITYADSAGNRMINHFAQHGVLFDAHDASVIPGGFCLRFRVARNADKTKLSGEEFDKLTSQCGLMGISTQPIHFKLDPQNLMISVEVFSGIQPVTGTQAKNTPDIGIRSLSTVGSLLTENLGAMKRGKKHSQQSAQESYDRVSQPDIHRQKFIDLGCYPADQFEEVVDSYFVERVMTFGSSTLGKSPIISLVAVALAKSKKAKVTLINPLPGTEKDWFNIPSVVPIVRDKNASKASIDYAVEELELFYENFKVRYKTSANYEDHPCEIVVIDEAGMISMYWEDFGEFIKLAGKTGSHTNTGLILANQDDMISGISGGAKKNNAFKLMKADYGNFVQIHARETGLKWLEAYRGEDKEKLQTCLLETQKLCNDLNKEMGLTDRPKVGDSKRTDPNAYRCALVACPGQAPFVIQIPAYNSLSIEGIEFPPHARITSPHLLEKEKATQCCPNCGSTIVKLRKPYANGDLRYECGDRLTCRTTFRIPAQ